MGGKDRNNMITILLVFGLVLYGLPCHGQPTTRRSFVESATIGHGGGTSASTSADPEDDDRQLAGLFGQTLYEPDPKNRTFESLEPSAMGPLTLPSLQTPNTNNLPMDKDTFDEYVKKLLGEFTDTDPNGKVECALRTQLARDYLNFTTENGETYCLAFFDGIQCWEESEPGISLKDCPSSFRGVTYTGKATRICESNGTWANENRSNYGDCEALKMPYEEGDGYHAFQFDIVHFVGYSVSFCTTSVALAILLCFKSLWCIRNYIHMNFIVSFLLIYVVFFIVIMSTTVENANTGWRCHASELALVTLTVANFCWMFVEGVFLYCTVVLGHQVRHRVLWLYGFIGWGMPLIITATQIVVQLCVNSHYFEQTERCLERSKLDYIHGIPTALIVLINFYFMIHIIVVIKRQRSSNSSEMQQYKKAFRALFVLTPLLGGAYLLFIVEPTEYPSAAFYHVYTNLLMFCHSTQGFFVALIYVFLNPEVHNIIKRRFSSWREDTTAFTIISRRESKSQPPSHAAERGHGPGGGGGDERSCGCGEKLDADASNEGAVHMTPEITVGDFPEVGEEFALLPSQLHQKADTNGNVSSKSPAVDRPPVDRDDESSTLIADKEIDLANGGPGKNRQNNGDANIDMTGHVKM
ncbi:corticotropin-releasing factor receptor 2-like [Diadema antillarum]|uniref:corticotropin-releasing factor receptor 2-like n=1 Tax=Diadema antillarum TaxID=105358 RepID=UPI003A88BDF9